MHDIPPDNPVASWYDDKIEAFYTLRGYTVGYDQEEVYIPKGQVAILRIVTHLLVRLGTGDSANVPFPSQEGC